MSAAAHNYRQRLAKRPACGPSTRGDAFDGMEEVRSSILLSSTENPRSQAWGFGVCGAGSAVEGLRRAYEPRRGASVATVSVQRDERPWFGFGARTWSCWRPRLSARPLQGRCRGFESLCAHRIYQGVPVPQVRPCSKPWSFVVLPAAKSVPFVAGSRHRKHLRAICSMCSHD